MLTTLPQGARREGRIIANSVSADRLASKTQSFGDIITKFLERQRAIGSDRLSVELALWKAIWNQDRGSELLAVLAMDRLRAQKELREKGVTSPSAGS